ncbi:uncharacterized protein LOC141642253 [Silene latifolia]|uniref:uncharacterized protein LOC141642253 n=1 Tax=Silene latifolia TaxID=37657 RepID=UPI003D781E7A
MATAKMSELEHQARLELMIKEAAGKVVFNESIIQDNYKVTKATMHNSVKDLKDLVVYDSHSWLGDVVESYPSPVHNMDTDPYASFIHQGSDGSKGGVVYVDGTDSTARKWLAAFDAPNNKCYVECGPIGPTNWKVVEENLNQSGNLSSYNDPVLGGWAGAHVYRDPDGNVNQYHLYIAFSR